MCMGGGGDPAEIKETNADWANAEIAAQQWNRYQSVFKPFERKWIRDATMQDGALAAKQGTIAGRANADVAQAAASQLKPLNPFKGSAISPALTSALGTTMGNANINANEAVKNLQIAGMTKVTDLGRGQANSADLGMANLAQQASQNAVNQSAIDWENTANTAETLGSLAGTGASLAYNANKNQNQQQKNQK